MQGQRRTANRVEGLTHHARSPQGYESSINMMMLILPRPAVQAEFEGIEKALRVASEATEAEHFTKLQALYKKRYAAHATTCRT